MSEDLEALRDWSVRKIRDQTQLNTWRGKIPRRGEDREDRLRKSYTSSRCQFFALDCVDLSLVITDQSDILC